MENCICITHPVGMDGVQLSPRAERSPSGVDVKRTDEHFLPVFSESKPKG